MESERRKVYVEVNVTHRPDGTARPNFIKFENDEKYEIDRVIQKCRAASTKVGGTGIRYYPCLSENSVKYKYLPCFENAKN